MSLYHLVRFEPLRGATAWIYLRDRDRARLRRLIRLYALAVAAIAACVLTYGVVNFRLFL